MENQTEMQHGGLNGTRGLQGLYGFAVKGFPEGSTGFSNWV